MAKLSKAQSTIGNIIHSAAERYRIRGKGLLRTRLLNQGEILSEENSLRYVNLDPINMNLKSNQEKTVLSNFQDQGIQLQFKTIHINETFNISKIILFTKPVAEGYPIKSGAI